MKVSLILLLAVALVTGCATGSHVITGTVRPPVVAQQVKLYDKAPEKFEVIGFVNANYDGNGQSAMDAVVLELKKQAGAIGANGVLVGQTSQTAHTASAGYAAGGALGGILFSASQGGSTTVSGQAIYVP
ncbi:MAG: hypothetical protein JWR19_3179 [Pedosphaera sp.]|nr:hypothetical protein [Pedosphaera sp.]